MNGIEERLQLLQQQIMGHKAMMLDLRMQFEEAEKHLVALVSQSNALQSVLNKPEGEA